MLYEFISQLKKIFFSLNNQCNQVLELIQQFMIEYVN